MTAASDVRNFRSIITLIVFIFTNVVVVFPFKLPIPISYPWRCRIRKCLVNLRILRAPHHVGTSGDSSAISDQPPKESWKFPVDPATAPVISVLFLLACTAIHRQEVHDGILGSDGIVPISIMAFFIALAYIAISLDQTGLIRFIAVWVLRKGGENGRRLYLYLYMFYLALATVFGNDPVILSATPFIAYMTKASANIKDPRAWIYGQFACANIASAILVSSNPTNLVLSGAFGISYITYTGNMIIPVVLTSIILYPILVGLIFPSDDLIPRTIDMHALPGEKPAEMGPRPNGTIDLRTNSIPISMTRIRSRKVDMDLEEILHPYLEKRAAIFCVVLFVITLAVLLATNAAGAKVEVYAITVPAAFVMLCRDLVDDWVTLREGSGKGSIKDIEAGNGKGEKVTQPRGRSLPLSEPPEKSRAGTMESADMAVVEEPGDPEQLSVHTEEPETYASQDISERSPNSSPRGTHDTAHTAVTAATAATTATLVPNGDTATRTKNRKSLQSVIESLIGILEHNFPRACTVISQLPFGLLPFTFGMFILVQGLVTKGWVQIFANGWQGWVNITGTLGAIGGMGLVSVLLCNFAGTNIGTTIVLSRILQEWLRSHHPSDRTKQASIYAMAIGVNYGAFSLVFSASLAGLLWRSILERKGIHVGALSFARYNMPIIFVCMTVGCGVLAAQVYIVKDGHTQ